MKVISISRKAFEKLEKMELSRNVRNTEAVMYNFSSKHSSTPMVFKKLHHQNGSVFGNKLFTIELLDSNRDYLPSCFCIPNSLVTVNGVVQGFVLPKIEGRNLSDILKDSNESVETQIFYLKKVGQILEHLDKIRKNTDLKVMFINDLHESNFIIHDFYH